MKFNFKQNSEWNVNMYVFNLLNSVLTSFFSKKFDSDFFFEPPSSCPRPPEVRSQRSGNTYSFFDALQFLFKHISKRNFQKIKFAPPPISQQKGRGKLCNDFREGWEYRNA